MDTLLEIRDLKVNFHTPAGTLHAVRGVDFDVPAGKVVAVVGESGCGKSVTAKAIMGLIESPAKVEPESRIYFEGKNLVENTEKEWNAFRGKDCSIIFQDALVALNPTVPVGKQISGIPASFVIDIPSFNSTIAAGISPRRACFKPITATS